MDKTYFVEIIWLVSNVFRSKVLSNCTFCRASVEVRVVFHSVRVVNELQAVRKKFSNLLNYAYELNKYPNIF